MRKKAELFEYDLFSLFCLERQILCKLKNPTPEQPFISYNMPDDAYMTGMMAAVFSFKYAVTGDPKDKETVSLLLRGLDRLCHVSGKKGLLARAWWPLDNPNVTDGGHAWHVNEEQGVRWNGDVSTDQMDGVFFGFYYAYKLAADEAEKEMIARDVAELMDALIENGLRIIDIGGNMTRWGDYTVEHLIAEEHLHGLLLMQHLKIAEYVTGDAKYGALYRKIAVEDRLALNVRVVTDGTEVFRTFAVNEASVEKAARERMLEVVIEVDDRPLSRFGCDGVVCATPTGSTAYNFSGGGPIVWPAVEALLMVPISAHALFARPLVVAPTSKLAVEVVGGDAAAGVLWCDGRRDHDLPAGARIEVTRADEPVRLVRLHEDPFTDRLVAKFDLPVQGWRGAAELRRHQAKNQAKSRARNQAGAHSGTGRADA
jgi:hypothetical protein